VNRFSDRVAVVTGGASGIGEATVTRFAAEGARVVIADIDDRLGSALAANLSAGGEVLYQHCDVCVLEDWTALVRAVITRFGRIDIVHNNAAGRYGRTPTHQLDERDWDYQLDLTVKQIFLSVKACVSHLIATTGVIINTSSVHALFGFPGQAPYDAGKGAVSSITRQLAAEYGPEVRVNAVVPGAIVTPAWAGVPEDEREWYKRETPAARLGAPDDVAAAVCFLASDDASFITGANLVVDGGWSITKHTASAPSPRISFTRSPAPGLHPERVVQRPANRQPN
jgi:NAD(P)-dependent dehydrogenase (short-subunit alcohol dehydrogenase family)